MDRVFVDTAAWLALVNKTDEFHEKAKDVRKRLLEEEATFITTNQVIIEVANSLSKPRFRKAVVGLITSIWESENITVVKIEDEIYSRSWEMYKDRDDKEWSLTDCMSFVVMEDKAIQSAFTTDHHFEQAGFTILLEAGERDA